MTTSLPVRAATVAATAVLALGLVGCGTEQSAGPERVRTPVAPPSSSAPSSPSAPPSSPPSAPPAPAPADLGPRDREPRIDFPGVEAVFPDGSSAASDGEVLVVTTPAEEKASVDLPTSAEGWFLGTSVDLGDAGTGYVVSQSGGEYLRTFLAVLDDGELYLPEPDDEVVFGQWAGEGPRFETWTSGGGAHLLTRIEDGPDGRDRVYEWTVRDRRMVPTLVS